MANNVKSVTGGTFGNAADEFKVAGPQIETCFDFEQAVPPGAAYIDVNDQLYVAGASQSSNFGVTINVRILRPDGFILPLKFSANSSTNRQIVPTTFPLMEGFLLSVSVVANTTVSSANWPYFEIGLTRGPFGIANVYRLLCAGYLNGQTHLGWPESAPIRGIDGPGFYHSLVVANPAAGADFSTTVAVSSRLRVVSISATLTAAVAVANRLVSLVLDDGANIFSFLPTGVTVVASGVNIFTWADSLPIAAPFDGKSMAPLPTNLILTVNMRLRSLTTGIQPADQWSAITLEVAEWIDNL